MAANACVTEKAQSNAATSVVGSFVFSAAGCFILGRLWLSGVAAGAAGTARCMRLRRTGAVAPRLLAACCRNAGRHNAASTGVPAVNNWHSLELRARTLRNPSALLAYAAAKIICSSSAELAYCKTLASKRKWGHAAVQVSFGSLLVQRDQWDTYWGAKKIFFLIREIDDATMAGASVESCRFVVLRSPGGRIGSVLDVRNRLRRMRGRFHRRQIHISTGAWQCADLWYKSYQFGIQSSLESSKHGRIRRRPLPDPRPIPERVRGPICIRKKCAIWT